jgi:hypothetical protein
VTFFELYSSNDMAGQEGFEPPALGFGVRRSTVRATGLFNPFTKQSICIADKWIPRLGYLVSLCEICFLQNRQYLLNSSLSGVVRLFLVVV